METISVKLPAKLRQQLADEAKRRQVTQSVLIRETLEQTLKKRGRGKNKLSCADLAADLVGSISGPRDLATNQKHLTRAIEKDRRRGQRHR